MSMVGQSLWSIIYWLREADEDAITEPSSATVLGTVANCTVEDFHTAVEAADKAQQKYQETTTGAQRGAFLRKWNDLILANADDR